MAEEKFQKASQRAPSVPRKEGRSDSGFSVKASPFNPVKLELGYLLLVGVLLFLVIHRITEDPWQQIVVLFIYGLASMLWLVYRIRVVSRQQDKQEE